MGGNGSKDQQNAKSPAQSSNPDRRNLSNDTKKVLLLHKSDTKEKETVVRNFRDALTDKASGSIKVETMVNIANANKSGLKDSSWLEEINNVVLICLTPEAIPILEQIINEKGFVNDGRLNAKVFTVSFGASLDAQWPPNGVQRADQHVRDFAFNFENVDNLRPQDFARSDRITALVAAMKGIN